MTFNEPIMTENEPIMTEKVQLSSYKYFCTKCEYSTSRRSQYDRHLTTSKHRRTTENNEMGHTMHSCGCGKIYRYRQGLFNHRKTCNFNPTESISVNPVESTNVNNIDTINVNVLTNTVLELVKQNQEFKEMMIEQHKQIQEQNKQIIDLAKTSGNTTNNTNNTINNNNNKFNLNVFLNETCKDAINLNDFIQSIELTIRDFVNTGKDGYVKGISNIMLERIRDMDPHVRPIHCTDLKRETVYVKDSDIWAKEDDNKTHIRKAVRIVANKNKDQVHSWIQENPNYEVLDTPECDKFFEYSKASLGGYGKEENSRFENKIISNVLKEVVVNKDKMLE